MLWISHAVPALYLIGLKTVRDNSQIKFIKKAINKLLEILQGNDTGSLYAQHQ